MNSSFERLLVRAEHLMQRIEAALPRPVEALDWGASFAFRYRRRAAGLAALLPVRHMNLVALDVGVLVINKYTFTGRTVLGPLS